MTIVFEEVREDELMQKVFFELLKAGLWETNVRLVQYGDVDFSVIRSMADAQGVVGLVVAGIEHIIDVKPAKEELLQFIGRAVQIERHNEAMKRFTVEVVEKMYKDGLHPLLVKGQGLAQCYERPNLRPSGDIDFFFDKDEFYRAASFFTKLSNSVVQNARYTKSFGVVVDSWFVEVHGTLRSGLSSRIDKEIDAVQEDTFKNGKTRLWRVGNTDVLLPCVNNDLFLVFTHFVRHFYKGGMSLRQLCDWCRLMWIYQEDIDVDELGCRLHRFGLTDEWLAFASLVVDWLDMPVEAMPFYNNDAKWHEKAGRILDCVMRKGGLEKSVVEAYKLFPLSTIRFLPSLLFNVNGMKLDERVKECIGLRE